MKWVSIVRLVAPAVVGLSLAGCGESSGGGAGQAPIPVINPDPNNPLKDVTLENEAQNLDKIKAGNGKPSGPAKKVDPNRIP